MMWNDIAVNVISGVVLGVFAALVTLLFTERRANRRESERIVDSRAWEKSQTRLQQQAEELVGLRERDMAAAAELYRVYGSFFATWKSWNSRPVSGTTAALDMSAPDRTSAERRGEFLAKSATAEGDLESLLLRIAVEHNLSFEQRAALWSLRISFKSLRYAIEDGLDLEWWRSDQHGATGHDGYRSYQAFKGLTAFVASLLLTNTKSPVPLGHDPSSALREVTGDGALFTQHPAFADAISQETGSRGALTSRRRKGLEALAIAEKLTQNAVTAYGRNEATATPV
ncbi:hypothetical protein [Glaciibacter sp. 2TAF33]|uniref:hypothetical protein n=1 Tax=Glaciibacter sp. 2TAF33 TaxID=3233015 RepID=UPI003F90080D